MTVPNVPPWGTLSLAAWTPLFAKTSVSPPTPGHAARIPASQNSGTPRTGRAA
jgi:hypothetical protein